MRILETRSQKRLAALILSILVLAVACGAPPASIPVSFRKTTYNDGTTNHEVLAVENGNIVATVSDSDEVDTETMDEATLEVRRSGATEGVDGEVVEHRDTETVVRFPLTAGIQDPESTEPTLVDLCVFFNVPGADADEGAEVTACEEVLVPPARRPTPPDSGGSHSPPPSSSSFWHNITTQTTGAPSERAGAAMAELPDGRVLLFGGSGSTGPLGDTWRYDGATWEDVTPAGTSPSARSGAAMAFDGHHVVLFGGDPSDTSTWVWDDNAETWTEVPATAGDPAPRIGASMTSFATGGSVAGAVLFGGEDSSLRFSDTWVWDGTTWTDVSTSGPSGRSFAAMVFDPIHSMVVLHGGDTNGATPADDTWLWDPSSPTWIDATDNHPGPRAYGDMAPSDQDEPVVLYGGYTGAAVTDHADLWTGSWNHISTPGQPPARSGHSLATFIHGGQSYALLFGGHDASGNLLAETWVYDPTP